MKHLIQTTVLFICCGLLLNGCPFIFGWPYHEYEPQQPEIGDPDNTAGSLLEVNETQISIVIHDTGASVFIPIETPAGAPSVEVRAWVEEFTIASELNEVSQTIDLRAGPNIVGLSMDPLPGEDPTNLRLGYEIDAGDGSDPLHGYVSVEEAVSQLHLYVYAPDPLTAGDSAMVRIMSTLSGKPVAIFDASADLVVGETTLSASAHSSSLGIVSLSIDVPGALAGEGELRIHAATPDGMSRDYSFPVTVEQRGALLLTLDKPRYQPGQTMHLRVMALQRPGMTPLAAQDVLIEAKDGKGFKVFKKTVRTNALGIASTRFKLAGQVNMGTYEVKAVLGDKQAVEKIIVEHYVLPKFSIALNLSRGYILSGEPLQGTVDLRYTFGEAVGAAMVSLALAYGDDTLITTLTGSTDTDGRFQFSMDVPALADTGAVKLTVTATDAAGQTAMKEAAVPSAREGIRIWMVPAHDRTAGKPWVVYIVARDPSGGPVTASGEARLGLDVMAVETNGLGIAQVELPPDADAPVLNVDLQTPEGLRGAADFDVKVKDFPLGISLQTDRTRYEVGETAGLIVQAPAGLAEALIEVSSRGKIVHDETVPLGSGGEASVSLPVSSGMDGVMIIEAFGIDETGELFRGRTAMYVFSEQKLTTAVALDKEVYLPGETARLDVSVKDRSGSGVPSALGIVVVDEAVFALQSFNPTSYKKFFAEQTVSKNVANVMDREQAEALLETDDSSPGDQEMASRALLAANAYEQGASDLAMKDIDTEREIYHATFAINSDLVAISNYLSNMGYYESAGPDEMRALALEMEASAADPWGRLYDIEIQDLTSYSMQVSLVSSGPDESMGTEDDITVRMTANY